MKARVSIMLLFISISVFGQQTKEWINKLNNPEDDTSELKKENLTTNYLTYDFSTLFVPRQEFWGYIGSDYRSDKIDFSLL